MHGDKVIRDRLRAFLAGALVGVAFGVIALVFLRPILPEAANALPGVSWDAALQAFCTIVAAYIAFVAIGHQIAKQQQAAARARWADQLAVLQEAWQLASVVRSLTKMCLDLAVRADVDGRQPWEPLPHQEAEVRRQCAAVAAVAVAELPVDARAPWIMVIEIAADLLKVLDQRRSISPENPWTAPMEHSTLAKLKELVQYIQTGPVEQLGKVANRVRGLLGLQPADSAPRCLDGVQP